MSHKLQEEIIAYAIMTRSATNWDSSTMRRMISWSFGDFTDDIGSLSDVAIGIAFSPLYEALKEE